MNYPKWMQGTWAVGVSIVVLLACIGGCAVMWGSDPVTKETKPGAQKVANVTCGSAFVICSLMLVILILARKKANASYPVS